MTERQPTTTTLAVRLRRTLELDPAQHPRGVPHLAAASALVRVGRLLHAIADDEHHLVTFDGRSPRAPLALHPLFPGTLPAGQGARKRRKPDLESLLAIDDPADPAAPAIALVALGSGSRPNRRQGAWIDLDAEGRPAGKARRIDLSALHLALERRFEQVNIEGAFRLGDRLCLLQRANARTSRNAIVQLDWRTAAAWLGGGGRTPRIERIVEVSLGAIGGVPCGFTDGAFLDGDMFVFTAAAEATDDAVADGATGGSLVGVGDATGRVRARTRVSGRRKIEGVAVRRDARDPRTLVLDLVTDADDPDEPSALLRARWRP